jgi:putative heme iron utilization protein
MCPSDGSVPRMSRARDHVVSAEDAAQTRQVLAATPGLKGEPSDAERGRTLLAGLTHGQLATVEAREPVGYPFGSLVAYALDDLGRPLLCLSDLAEHSTNLAADPRASLLVAAAPLSTARVTLVGDLREVSSADRPAAHERYRQVHDGASYSGFADFRIYRLEVAAVRYVGGFGRMSWVSPREYREAEPDPLTRHVVRIVRHMNDDHADALVAFCRVLAGRAATSSARMIGVDRYGFDVLANDSAGGAPKAVRFAFDAPTDTPDAVRAAMVALVHQTR